MKRSQNEKYKRIYNFTIPAFQTKTGFKTCPNAGICATGCYARSGAYMFSNVYKKHMSNLETTKQPNFKDLVNLELIHIKADLIRVHDSGDFYSSEYFLDWLRIATANPNIQFYAYTKMIGMVKAAQTIGIVPNNFTIIFSLGGKQDELIDQTKDRHSKVFNNIKDLEDQGYIDTSHDDTLALGSNPKIGLVYHGVKSYTNTAWSSVK